MNVRYYPNRRQLIWEIIRHPGGFWSDHPNVDLALCLLFVGGHAFVVYKLGHGNVLHWADQSQRLAIYSAGAGVMSLIAGFAGTAIAAYGSSSGPVVTALRSAHGEKIRSNWRNLTRYLLTAAVLCLVAMAIDSKTTPRGSQWVFEAALAIAVAKFSRLAFLFDLILTAVDSGAENPRPKRTLTRRNPNATAEAGSVGTTNQAD
ncbi:MULTISPECIES: hypothetical protein [unclassified Micromonospora]|uniref:hypothetical protein n=1 Tax=unclassified Micromonospora TaxID=2617518 RepID=UPI0013045E1C|nr:MULTISPECIES: hypothetical protein [unclassified Micromonospora]MDI5937191.1 hypothetical protein [Micromonospora sp. DH15]